MREDIRLLSSEKLVFLREIAFLVGGKAIEKGMGYERELRRRDSGPIDEPTKTSIRVSFFFAW